jgi:hypothetical protein
MPNYLEGYGAEDERRLHMIKRLAIAGALVFVIAIGAYFFFKNFPEKQIIKGFLAQVNSGQLQSAYETWGCTQAHPCKEYSYQKFVEDWGRKAGRDDWHISGVDGCRNGVIITVQTRGSEPEPLWVERSNKVLSFSPWPECQERKWRFRQFFHRLFGSSQDRPRT